MVRQTVRDFVDEEILPIIEECNREEKFPHHLIPKMAEMGLFGATIKEYDLPG
jgi:glutaryl-CoA dehydrogenase